jgi:hypothetical protein
VQGRAVTGHAFPRVRVPGAEGRGQRVRSGQRSRRTVTQRTRFMQVAAPCCQENPPLDPQARSHARTSGAIFAPGAPLGTRSYCVRIASREMR